MEGTTAVTEPDPTLDPDSVDDADGDDTTTNTEDTPES